VPVNLEHYQEVFSDQVCPKHLQTHGFLA
jgi:hypothetical protein